MTTSAKDFRGRELELELLDPGSLILHRLFKHNGGDWEPPPEVYRNLRVDPPDGHKAAYAVLYTGDTLATVATECHVLSADLYDRYTWNSAAAQQYRVVRYQFDAPAMFVPIDGRNRDVLGLRRRSFGTYADFQRVSFELFRRYGRILHGLSWDSFHRNQPGRVYALWHHHKDTIGLRIEPPPPYPLLTDDPQWQAFLAEHPEIERVDS